MLDFIECWFSNSGLKLNTIWTLAKSCTCQRLHIRAIGQLCIDDSEFSQQK